MNPLVHITMGLHAANLGFHQRYGARASLILVTASLFPDIDSVVLLFGRQAYLQYHRGFTHSVSGWVVCGAIMALLSAWKRLPRYYRLPLSQLSQSGVQSMTWKQFRWWYLIDWGLWSLGMAGHTAADLITRWPIPVLYPFSDRRWSFPLVSWGDGLLTSLWLILAVAACVFTYYRRSISGVAWGLGLFYLSYRVVFPSPGASWLSRLWVGFWMR
jgi:membrane-bound metal-dependent hydrolase YbcI (DUF457 family)